MERLIKFTTNDFQAINLEDFSDEEFAIAKMGFLSTKPNSHGLIISEEVLKQSAPSVLNKWVVADMVNGEPSTHTENERIVGRIPQEQDIEFIRDKDGYLRAYVDTVISKIYAKDFCDVFNDYNNSRAVSVEMKVLSDNDDENLVDAFNIVGVTVLGYNIKPSCPDSDIVFTRFSEQDADKFFYSHKSNNSLKTFMETRERQLAEKTYKVDKSKDAVSNKTWGDIDKIELRNKIMEASNKSELVKDVYMLVEDGWEDAPSEKLKYPVMCFVGDVLVYNRGGLSSALAYAKQNNEEEVINKVKAIYDELDLDDDSEGKEEKDMSEVEFSAVNISDLWSQLYNGMREVRHWDFYIKGIYEEDNKKFAIICDDSSKLYRLDFSLTEEGLTLADEIIEIKEEFIETDNMRKFAEPENVEEYRLCDQQEDNKDEEEFEGEQAEMSLEEATKKIADLEKDILSRDNIIMEKDKELEELRAFKADIEEKEKAILVESVMEDVKDFIDIEQYNSMREEGLGCDKDDIDAWSNKVKAFCFSSVKNQKNDTVKKSEIWSFGSIIKKQNNHSLWD